MPTDSPGRGIHLAAVLWREALVLRNVWLDGKWVRPRTTISFASEIRPTAKAEGLVHRYTLRLAV